MTPDQAAIDALAEAFADMRGMGNQYRLERDLGLGPDDARWKATKDFCEGEIDHLYSRLRSLGFDIVKIGDRDG